jgi:hypothetical protein
MLINLIIKGIAVGFSIAAPVGAIGFCVAGVEAFTSS